MALNNFTGTSQPPSGPGAPPSNPNTPTPSPGVPTGPNNQTDALEYLINYNDKFAASDPILHRDAVLRQTLAILIAKNKPNALLIGAAGVGKTKIAEAIARMLATNDPIIPDKLRNHVMYELPLSNIVAGSSYVGQVEQKIQSVIEFLSDPKNKAIVFIDEIHQLAGDNQIYGKIAQIMKPALARGDIRTIGATTLQEANKLMDDPALNRRFTRVIVDEFTQEQTLEVLQNAMTGFINHYNNQVIVPDDMLPLIVSIADEYKAAGNHRPDTALTLLDKTMGEAIVARKVMQQQAQSNPMIAQTLAAMPVMTINQSMIKQTALRMMTGNAQKQGFDLDQMTQALSRIKGQNHIIEAVLKLLKQHDSDLFPKTTPMAILFAGNSGTGKTEIVKIIAETMTGVKPITLNMTEYHSSASINRIIGSPSGYIGSESDQELPFDCLEANPYQIILLDEFEKCDKSVQRLFMSAFDEGYIKTNRGKIVDFSRSIIVATTNAAHGEIHAPIGFGKQTQNKAKEIQALSGWFDMELLNRFKAILTFNPLEKPIYKEILVEAYQAEVQRIKQNHPHLGILDKMPDDIADQITEETYVAAFGARPVAKAVREYIESQV